MQLTVRELIALYRNGKVHTEQTTQRSFIYNNMKIFTDEKGDDTPVEITRAGDVITTILCRNLKLGAITAWNVQDDEKNIHMAPDEFNITDSKQRFLSILYFVCPELYSEGAVVTRILNREYTFDNLTEEQQNKILDYAFDVVWNVGTLAEEEAAFMVLNDRYVPLTNYEKLRGAYYGKFFTSFEKWVEEKSLTLDGINHVGRGESAQYILYTYLGLIDGDRKIMWKKANDLLPTCRNSEFDPKPRKMDEKVELFSRLMSTKAILTNNSNKDPEKLWRIVEFVIDNNFDANEVLKYYQDSKLDKTSDVGTWKVEIHKTAIRALAEGTKCDYKRFLTRQEKGAFYNSGSANHRCPVCGEVFAKGIDTDDLEIDHIIAWSKGGRTEWRNLQFVHKACNGKKGVK